MSTTDINHHSRLCNNLIRNLCLSIAAEKNNLYATYGNAKEISSLGINLYCGENTYNETVILDDESFENLIEKNICDIKVNLNPNNSYFQTTKIIKYLYNYLHSKKISSGIIETNPWKERYNNNNDCYVHIRLGDIIHFNPGFEYYNKVLSSLKFDNLFISSDTIEHPICKIIIQKFNAIIIDVDEVKTIQFASTCKYIVLSNGSFSSVIGYLSFYATDIFYPQTRYLWHGDLFCIPSWKKIDL